MIIKGFPSQRKCSLSKSESIICHKIICGARFLFQMLLIKYKIILFFTEKRRIIDDKGNEENQELTSTPGTGRGGLLQKEFTCYI